MVHKGQVIIIQKLTINEMSNGLKRENESICKGATAHDWVVRDRSLAPSQYFTVSSSILGHSPTSASLALVSLNECEAYDREIERDMETL